LRDIETVNLELIFADLEMLEKKIDKSRKMLKSGDKKFQTEINLYETLKANLEKGIPARALSFSEDERLLAEQLFLLTSKPLIYVANVSENDLANNKSNPMINELEKEASKEGSQVLKICAKIEDEISQLDNEDKAMFLQDLGIDESGLDKLIKASYHLLGLISFFTAGQPEVRAWTIKKGTHAPQAAGKIHSDFERGFIRAEVISFDELIKAGSYNAAKEKGLIRSEGKDYIMQDGDVVLFRFNV